MFNPMNKMTRVIFVDGNGVVATRDSRQIQSDMMQDRLVIARLKTVDDIIYGMPTYYDDANAVIWFQFTNGNNNLAQIVGIDENAEIVYYTGE